MKRIMQFTLLFSLLLLVGCGTVEEYKTLSTVEFEQAITDDETFVLDVRGLEEQNIPGTNALIPHDELEQYIDMLPKNKNTPVAVYCRSGVRSAKAMETLKEMGYKRIYGLDGGILSWQEHGFPVATSQFTKIGVYEKKASLFKSSSCGCCGIYSQYAESNDIDVRVSNTENMNMIKRKYNIPARLQSCHTTIMDGYFIEGHIPMEAIDKLSLERPDIAGIALPGMPSGTPGMPGAKLDTWVIYAVNHDGSYEEFMRI